ncbi:dsRNA-gated channel SID-1 [Popillia japonica]|uniref:DsRNA-gated channel SID-1 n=1 Tax=Popillia japonica TaxID=7064 RepID=A0AAW1MPZ3_POPJA
MNPLKFFSAIITVISFIVFSNAQTESIEHSMIYQRGYYGVDNVLELNLNKEYILAFPNTSTSNPYRISAYSELSTFHYPALLVVRQEKQVLSWQVPMILPSTLGLLYFRNTSRTLCYSSRAALGQFDQANNKEFKRNFSVSVSTSSPETVQVIVRADEVKQFYLENDKTYTAKISPSEPIFYHYSFPDTERSSRVYIEIDSEDDVCLIASVQDTFCPVRDLNQDIEFQGHFQTINMKGAMTISELRYPNGFFLVFVARSDNYECTQESSLLPLPRSLLPSIKTLNRTSEIKFTIREGPTEQDYLAATLVVFLVIVGFCIVFVTIIVIFYCCRKENIDEVDGDEDEVDTCGLTQNDIIHRYLDRDELTVQDFCAKRMQRKSFNYFWHIMNIAIFYGIPVVQLMVAYQRLVNVTGDLDTCYHNFMCANPLGYMNDFNHVYSNIGYMLLGIFFLAVTFVSHQKHVVIAKCGIPRHYGLFYAMGVALIVEGILSACYHICPNQSNYQFDTSFMYVMAVLIMVKLYQNRHPRINASAYATFTVLGVAVFMAAFVSSVLMLLTPITSSRWGVGADVQVTKDLGEPIFESFCDRMLTILYGGPTAEIVEGPHLTSLPYSRNMWSGNSEPDP